MPLEFGTIAVSDGISMGTEGMKASLVSREVIADSVELMVQAERFDALVAIAGCDKSLPGMLMACARLDVPAAFLYGGTILPGHALGRSLTIQDVFEAVGGAGGRRDVRRRPARGRAGRLPGRRARAPGMYTANTMSACAEALGMALPGAASPPAVSAERTELARRDRRGRRAGAGGRAAAAPDHDPDGVPERGGRGDGHRRVDQRGAAPAGDRRARPRSS